MLLPPNRQRKFRQRKRKREEEAMMKRIYRQRQRELVKAKINPPSIVKCVSGCGDYITPEKYKKQIRQRTHECSQLLPKSPGLKGAVVNRLVKKLKNCPSTQPVMKQIVNRYSSPCRASKPLKKSDAIQKIVMKIRKHRTNKDKIRLNNCVNELLQISSIRGAAKRLHIPYTTLHRLIKIQEKSVRRVSDLDVQNVRKFYKNSRISMQLPYKKYAKFYYLRSPLAVAYEEYAREQNALNCRVLSKSAVYRCLKGIFRVRKRIPFKECLCDVCLNNSLLVDALIAAGIRHVHRRITQNITLSFCPTEKIKDLTSRKLELDESQQQSSLITDHNHDCIFRNCQKCGAVHFQEGLVKANADYNVDWSKIVIWHQWEKAEAKDDNKNNDTEKKKDRAHGSENKTNKPRKYWDKFRYSGTLSNLLSLFTQSLHNLSVHMFDFRWQAFQFDECKKLLQHGDCLFIIDFAQNRTHRRQDEAGGGYWSRKQTTLHPFIIYFPCLEKCGHLVKEEVLVFSDEMRHDGAAVNKFFVKVLEHLEERQIPLKRMIIFSDNCAPQYKSCKVFDTLSKRNIPVLHNYFGAKHGKAEADGAIGRLAQSIDAVVRSGQYELSKSEELAKYCQQFLTVGNDDKPGFCCHYRKSFYLVNDINREHDNDLVAVKGTLGLHSVRNTGIPGIIEVRESSCFCEICFLNVPGECKNKGLVKDFRWTCLSKRLSSVPRMTVNNVHWQKSSEKYVPPKKTIIKRRLVRKKTVLRYVKKKVKNAKKHIGLSRKKTDRAGNIDRNEKRQPSVDIRLKKTDNVNNIDRKDTHQPSVDVQLKKIDRGSDIDRQDVYQPSADIQFKKTRIDENVTESGSKINQMDKDQMSVYSKLTDVGLNVTKSGSKNGILPKADGNDGLSEKNNDNSILAVTKESDSDEDKKPLADLTTKKKYYSHKTFAASDSDEDDLPLSEVCRKRYYPRKEINEESDSDYEDNMPLTDVRKYLNTIPDRSPVTLRIRVDTKRLVQCETPGEFFYLDDYEKPPGVIRKKKKVRSKQVSKELIISGIDPLSPSPSHNVSHTGGKSVMEESQEECALITNSVQNPFSTPKHKNVPSMSEISLQSLSPILPSRSPQRDVSLSPGLEITHVFLPNTEKPKKFTWEDLHRSFVSCKTYRNLCEMIEKEEMRIPPLSPPFGDYPVDWDEIDHVAKSYIPSDTPEKFRPNVYGPVKTRGDGNCFFRAISRLVYGVQSKHLEIRCRIVIDCVRNIQNYTNHEYLMRGASHIHKNCTHIGAYYCSYSGIQDVGDRDLSDRGILDVFKQNILRIRHEREYCDIWHLHSIANVLNRKIIMLFPEENVRPNVRVDMHRVFLPNNASFHNDFCLLWSALEYSATRYNHVVPLIRR